MAAAVGNALPWGRRRSHSRDRYSAPARREMRPVPSLMALPLLQDSFAFQTRCSLARQTHRAPSPGCVRRDAYAQFVTTGHGDRLNDALNALPVLHAGARN